MQTAQKPITGENFSAHWQNPMEALTAFYYAFNNRDLDLMSQNWANTSSIAMDNPLGGITRGWESVQAVYRRIFEGKARVYVEFYDHSIHENHATFYAVGRERGFFETRGSRIDLSIRTSRIYQKIDGIWRQVHHHGSIENPTLLEQYQTLVSK